MSIGIHFISMYLARPAAASALGTLISLSVALAYTSSSVCGDAGGRRPGGREGGIFFFLVNESIDVLKAIDRANRRDRFLIGNQIY